MARAAMRRSAVQASITCSPGSFAATCGKISMSLLRQQHQAAPALAVVAATAAGWNQQSHHHLPLEGREALPHQCFDLAQDLPQSRGSAGALNQDC